MWNDQKLAHVKQQLAVARALIRDAETKAAYAKDQEFADRLYHIGGQITEGISCLEAAFPEFDPVVAGQSEIDRVVSYRDRA